MEKDSLSGGNNSDKQSSNNQSDKQSCGTHSHHCCCRVWLLGGVLLLMIMLVCCLFEIRRSKYIHIVQVPVSQQAIAAKAGVARAWHAEIGRIREALANLEERLDQLEGEK